MFLIWIKAHKQDVSGWQNPLNPRWWPVILAGLVEIDMQHVTLHLLRTKNVWPAGPCGLVSLLLWKRLLLLSPGLSQLRTNGHMSKQKSTIICSWIRFFVGQPLEHQSALHHNKNVHPCVTLCTSAAKPTTAVKKSTSANTNTSSLAAKRRPLSRFGFSYMP